MDPVNRNGGSDARSPAPAAACESGLTKARALSADVADDARSVERGAPPKARIGRMTMGSSLKDIVGRGAESVEFETAFAAPPDVCILRSEAGSGALAAARARFDARTRHQRADASAVATDARWSRVLAVCGRDKFGFKDSVPSITPDGVGRVSTFGTSVVWM